MKAIIQEKNTLFHEQKIEISLLAKKIHRIGFLNPKSHFSQKIFIGLDSSIRDLVDFGSRKMEFTFSGIWTKFEKQKNPQGN